LSAPHPRIDAAHPSKAPGPGQMPEAPDRPGKPDRDKVAAALKAGGCWDEHDRINQCGKDAVVLGCDHVGDKVRMIWRGCDSRLCPTCVKRLRKRRQQPTNAAVRLALEEHPAGQLVHLTFTAKRQAKLTREYLREFGKNITKWSRRVRVADNVLGLYRCLEVTYDPASSDQEGNLTPWHPHAHCLVLLRPGRSRSIRKHGVYNWGKLQRQLVKEWHDLTGCVRGCTKKNDSLLKKTATGCTRGGSLKMKEIWDLRRRNPAMYAAANEIAKYVTKGIEVYHDRGGDAGLHATADLARAISGRLRLGAGLGVFKVIKAKTRSEPVYCEHGHQMHRLGSVRNLLKWANKGVEDAAVALARAVRDYPKAWPAPTESPSRAGPSPLEWP